MASFSSDLVEHDVVCRRGRRRFLWKLVSALAVDAWARVYYSATPTNTSSAATLTSEVYAPEVKLDYAAFSNPEGPATFSPGVIVVSFHHPGCCNAVVNVFASLVRVAALEDEDRNPCRIRSYSTIFYPPGLSRPLTHRRRNKQR
ncbi:hypothetical protein QIS74_07917 [Colletotrichum tabaci]|uniref:Uncharacterized protein n=1 Tax=Colletotrichum tabaci TaxID=1209068 RepID=A0AAV9T6H9_9PEZI